MRLCISALDVVQKWGGKTMSDQNEEFFFIIMFSFVFGAVNDYNIGLFASCATFLMVARMWFERGSND